MRKITAFEDISGKLKIQKNELIENCQKQLKLLEPEYNKLIHKGPLFYPAMNDNEALVFFRYNYFKNQEKIINGDEKYLQKQCAKFIVQTQFFLKNNKKIEQENPEFAEKYKEHEKELKEFVILEKEELISLVITCFEKVENDFEKREKKLKKVIDFLIESEPIYKNYLKEEEKEYLREEVLALLVENRKVRKKESVKKTIENEREINTFTIPTEYRIQKSVKDVFSYLVSLGIQNPKDFMRENLLGKTGAKLKSSSFRNVTFE